MMEIMPFDYKSHLVRTVTMEDESVWFVAKDVCAVLEIINHRDAVGKALDEDEKGVAKIYTPGGTQDVIVISESGLYTLIMRSNKEEARPFRKWVTSEVLPTIRRTGRYEMPDGNRVASLVPVTREFRAALGLARLMGLGGNHARRKANDVVMELTGHDCMSLLQIDLTEPSVDDPVAEFLEERCCLDNDAVTSASDLYAEFKGWYEERDNRPGSYSQKRFGGRLKDRFSKQKTGTYFYTGIRLKENDPIMEQ